MMKKGRKNQEKHDQQLLSQVEDALFRRATGYEDASGKMVPPDIKAAMYWLENRSPERWKKSREKSSGTGDISLTDEEFAL